MCDLNTVDRKRAYSAWISQAYSLWKGQIKSASNMIEIFELLFVKAEKSSLVKENKLGM